MRNLRGFYGAVLAGGTLALAGACNRDNETGKVTSKTGGDTTTAPASDVAEKHDKALVRVINAVPGGGTVSIWAGDSVAFAKVAYKKATAYREIPDNLFDFKLRTTGGPETEPLAENRENLHDGGHYTIVALLDQGGAEKRNLRVLDDDLKPVPADKARIRFINGVPSDTDVDLFLRGQKDAIFDGVNFKTEAGWKEIAPAGGTLVVRPDNKTTVLASLPNVKLEGGKSYTFVLSGRPGKYDFVRIEDDVSKDLSGQ
jgi:hypothetical protein